tara:strand:- start:452 stop:808 length:357 start_codon:yes stop_codon:yes gene_type:complete
MDFSENIENYIELAVESYNGTYNSSEPLQDLISMGELVDRLSIVNFKLYTLKDKVMESTDESFRAWASVEDVKLVMERSRLKKAIDGKLVYLINKILSGDETGGVNSEVKRYGNENRS